jgi:hypothetical protein
MPDICDETKVFVYACQALYGLDGGKGFKARIHERAEIAMNRVGHLSGDHELRDMVAEIEVNEGLQRLGFHASRPFCFA